MSILRQILGIDPPSATLGPLGQLLRDIGEPRSERINKWAAENRINLKKMTPEQEMLYKLRWDNENE